MQSTFETTSAVTSGPVGAATADTLHTATILSTAEGATEGVTQNEIEAPSIWAEPPATFGADQLTEARWLPLSAVVASPGADALATEIAALVAGHEVTSVVPPEGPPESSAWPSSGKLPVPFLAACCAAGRAWSHYQYSGAGLPADFTGGPIAARQYLAACDAMVALGLLYQSRSIRYGSGIVWDDGGSEHFAGKAPRLWPAPALLAVAASHGVTPATLPNDFCDAYPTQPPAVPQPVQMFTLKQPRRSEKAAIPIQRSDLEAARLVDKVTGYNDWIARHDVAGCLPPRLKRVFTASWLLGGRWYAVGAEGNYQRMSEAERLGVTINGEPVVEVDVQASHLSIMHVTSVGLSRRIAGVVTARLPLSRNFRISSSLLHRPKPANCRATHAAGNEPLRRSMRRRRATPQREIRIPNGNCETLLP